MSRIKSDNDVTSNDRALRKLFVGGLDNRTTDDSMRKFFQQYGTVVDLIVMKDPSTQRSRGFGFITYAEDHMVDRAMANRPHRIDGKDVETKRAIPRDSNSRPENNVTTKKIFIGGFKGELTEQDLRSYFSEYGNVVSVSLPKDLTKNRLRGFAFVEFDDYDAVDKVVLRGNHEFNGRRADVKKAINKDDAAQKGRSNNNNSNHHSNDQSGGVPQMGGGMMPPWMAGNRMAGPWGQAPGGWNCGPMGAAAPWQQGQAPMYGSFGPQGQAMGPQPGFGPMAAPMMGYNQAGMGYGYNPGAMGFGGQMAPMYGAQTAGMAPNFAMTPGYSMPAANYPGSVMPNSAAQQATPGVAAGMPATAGASVGAMTAAASGAMGMAGYGASGGAGGAAAGGGGPMRGLNQSQSSRAAPYSTSQRSSASNGYSNGGYNRF